MAHLSVRLFGMFQAVLDGKPLNDFESNKARALLAYLMVEPKRAHSREQLAALLWSDWPQKSALQNLRHALSSLRRTINDQQTTPPFLIITRNTLQFNQNSSYDLDVADFENCLALSDQPGIDLKQLVEDQPDLEGQPSSIRQLQSACDLYQDGLLDGFFCDSPGFEDWVLIEREHFNRQILKALLRLEEYFETIGEFERAQLYARRQLELEPWLEEAHQQLMRLLALSGERSAALAQFETCRRSLKQELGVEPTRETMTLYESIRDQIFPPVSLRHPGRLEMLESEPPAPGEPPFKGLQFFDEADAELFFGRERLTSHLIERVSEYLSPQASGLRFLAVVGASGSGKSSIVRAGLAHALKHEQPPAEWSKLPNAAGSQIPFQGTVIVITPTARPLEALAIGMTRATESLTATATLMDDLSRDERSLHLAAARALEKAGSAHLLIIVDQFEELFSLCHAETERKTFVDNLLVAAGVPGPTIVVITLRADFYAQCAPFENLRQAVSEQQIFIGGMGFEELRRAIEGPAQRGKWALETGLVDILLRDAGSEPGALPLLSYALLETWRRRRGRRLTLAGYEASGGVKGAIARNADATFHQLTPEQQVIARSIFLRLIEPGEGGENVGFASLDTRRRASLAELNLSAEDTPLVQDVLNKLADARLVTISQDSVEVAHEALIREWARLREWLDENREGLHLQRRLAEAVQDWQKLGREGSALFRGARLAQALEWAEFHPEDLNVQERAFLEASLKEQQSQQADEAARQRRELEATRALAEAQRQRAESETRRAEDQAQSARKLRRRAVFLAVVLGASTLLLLVAAWLGIVANRNAIAAQEQTRLATSRELAAAAVSNLQVDPERSVLLALQALKTANTLEASNALHQALPELHILHTIPAHRQTPGVAYSPDGARLASLGVDGEVKVWDASTYQLLRTLPGKPGDVGYSVAYSPDGKYIAASLQTKVTVWQAESGQELFTLAGEMRGMSNDLVSFSPDSQRLAVAHMDGAPKVLDMATHTELFSLETPEAPCLSIAYSPDGKRLATGDIAGKVKIWDAETGQELLTLEQGGLLNAVAFSPDGARLASASDNGRLMVWDTAEGKELLSMPSRSGLYSVAFMPDGTRILATHQDGTTSVWDAFSGQQVLVLAGHVSTVVAVSASPDNRHIATAGYDGALKIWDTAAGQELLTVAAHAGPVNDIAYTSDGRQLVTASSDGTAKLRDVVSGQLITSITPESSTGGLTSLAVSPDGKHLATGGWNGIVNTWDARTGAIESRLTGHTNAVFGVAFSPDGMHLASTDWNGAGTIWDLSDGSEIVTFITSPIGRMLFEVVFSPDGKRVFTGSEFGPVGEWDASTGEQLGVYPGSGQEVYGVALSPDGRRLAIGWENGYVTVWDLPSKKQLLNFSAHAGLIAHLVFNGDGTRLATASFDKYAKVWDAANGKELMTLYGNPSNVYGVAFSPDGTRLATAGGDGTARIYTLKLDELVRLAQERVSRSLTTEECRKYLHLPECPK